MSGWGRNANKTITGTVDVVEGSDTVTGTGTAFLTELNAGEVIVIATVPYVVKSIESNTSLTLDTAYDDVDAADLVIKGAEKPTADKTLDQSKVYGADKTEVGVTKGIASPGWVYRRTKGSRVMFETLVAMKNPPTENDNDDVVLPDA